MGSVLYLLFFLGCGFLMARFLLPGLRPLLRGYIGLSLGLLLMMWLPVLLAYAITFSLRAHWIAAALMAALTAACYLLRDPKPAARWDEQDSRGLSLLCFLVIPLTVLSAYLQYTHSIRPAVDGTYHVGQSTYGDLSLHLAVTTSIVNAPFPLQNSLMLGATMAYPYLSDSFASSLYMLGLPLPAAMAVTGTVMMALVYTGYTLLCVQLCKRKAAAALAVCLFFFNGGLGFFYTLSGTVENGVTTTVWDNLRNVLTGYYQTPTNQPDPHNLRWSNIICDMLIPQRGILGGWTMLLPCFNLLIPPLVQKRKQELRSAILLGVFAGGLPLVHTHSFLALALSSGGMCLYHLCTTPKGERKAALLPWLCYVGVTAALALPQLISFTFVQATNSEHFLRFQFNWCNNRRGKGLVDPYFWFYIKNIGLPYLLIVLALFKKRGGEDDASVFQNRLLASGAFLIYGVAECYLFQPNEYDNNKLFYVWFLLCVPMVANYALELFERLRGLAGRRMIAAGFLVCCFLSAGLTVARECVSDIPAYSRADIEVAEFVKAQTPEHAIFVTGKQHLNPVSSLAGRTILCSADIYLFFHGFNTDQRRAEVAAFYANPLENLAFLKKYGVQYIYVSAHERNDMAVNEYALEAFFPLIYDTPSHSYRIFEVPQDLELPQEGNRDG